MRQRPPCDTPRAIASSECILSCPVLSSPVLSCPVLSSPVLSCPVLSCPVLSCPATANRRPLNQAPFETTPHNSASVRSHPHGHRARVRRLLGSPAFYTLRFAACSSVSISASISACYPLAAASTIMAEKGNQYPAYSAPQYAPPPGAPQYAPPPGAPQQYAAPPGGPQYAPPTTSAPYYPPQGAPQYAPPPGAPQQYARKFVVPCTALVPSRSVAHAGRC
ncbi:uncharacterized protein BJ171DRAFT_99525 [Polychytrium aggregatum]|uniref:uncharacterized protein n=1 Tax=Polychytrium aggregatum TaxID=110093 RepID=UPI0022FEE8F9|nr:uncharacterized protein BJ171DRAFT_99525 [Polychytrium aggregatum]KAI9204671.1 hypothetical protein BJ171DRAFT_99525 [Polychytrium aggregatum]